MSKLVSEGVVLGVYMTLFIYSSSLVVASTLSTGQETQTSSVGNSVASILKIIFDKILNMPEIDTSQMDCKNTNRTKDVNGVEIQINGTACVGKGNNSDVVFESVSSGFQTSSEETGNHSQTKTVPPSTAEG